MRQRFLPALTARTLYHVETMSLSALLTEIMMLFPRMFLKRPTMKAAGRARGSAPSEVALISPQHWFEQGPLTFLNLCRETQKSHSS